MTIIPSLVEGHNDIAMMGLSTGRRDGDETMSGLRSGAISLVVSSRDTRLGESD